MNAAVMGFHSVHVLSAACVTSLCLAGRQSAIRSPPQKTDRNQPLWHGLPSRFASDGDMNPNHDTQNQPSKMLSERVPPPVLAAIVTGVFMVIATLAASYFPTRVRLDELRIGATQTAESRAIEATQAGQNLHFTLLFRVQGNRPHTLSMRTFSLSSDNWAIRA
jgi:hypothetical protein